MNIKNPQKPKKPEARALTTEDTEEKQKRGNPTFFGKSKSSKPFATEVTEKNQKLFCEKIGLAFPLWFLCVPLW
ncbi:hypothetical protein [Citrifermentans bremense]|uniref:hypothetical protein n=1 Tax=Citrifermentans bremense TaxID=60035 RepID=UPI0012ECA4FB|nr:hypothetical protein [Citrifermentans bremense]